MSNEVVDKKETGSLALFGDDAAKGFENMKGPSQAISIILLPANYLMVKKVSR